MGLGKLIGGRFGGGNWPLCFLIGARSSGAVLCIRDDRCGIGGISDIFFGGGEGVAYEDGRRTVGPSMNFFLT